MTLKESTKKYDKHLTVALILVVIGIIDILLIAPLTMIGAIIIITLIFIAGFINAWFLWKSQWQYFSDLYNTVKDVWKRLRKKDPPSI